MPLRTFASLLLCLATGFYGGQAARQAFVDNNDHLAIQALVVAFTAGWIQTQLALMGKQNKEEKKCN